MTEVLNVYKPIGLTTFGLIQRLRQVYPQYAQATLGFAGRLDPMAEGVVLILVGEENNHREKYLGLDKEYVFEVLFGFATDTFDALGLISEIKDFESERLSNIKKVLRKYQGEFVQVFPPYSSKHVEGKALFQWAAEGRLHEIRMPQAQRTVHSLELLTTSSIEKAVLRARIETNISKVKGLFRQKEIIANWKEVLQKESRENYTIAHVGAVVSSGTYIRSLAQEIGKEMGSAALALSIKRTRVGEYREKDSLRLPEET